MQKTFVRSTFALFVLLIAATLCAPLVSAQDNMGGQGAMGGQGNTSDAAAKLEKMSAALQLTPAQKQQILPILAQEAPKLKALKADTSMPPLQKAMKLRQITESTDAQLKPILNPEQYEKLQQMQAQERQQMMQKMENR
ncbi:MAG: hypothetical protein WCC87_07595 [Candidatus Korobacteraceae bacterium]